MIDPPDAEITESGRNEYGLNMDDGLKSCVENRE